MKNYIFEYSEIGGGKGAEKKLAQAFTRAGAEVVSTGTDGKTKRTAGVSFKELMMTFADGQTVTAAVKSTGDIFQIKVNGKVTPIKAMDDHKAAVKELVAMLDAGRAKFQAALAKTKAVLPAGTKSKAVAAADQIKAQVEALDTQIAEATTKRDELKAELGDAAMDSVALDYALRSKPVTKKQAEVVSFIKTQINYDLAPHAYFIKNKAIGIDLSEDDELDSRMRNIESLGIESKKYRVEKNGVRNYALILDSADMGDDDEEASEADENQGSLFDGGDECAACCEKPKADCVCDNSALDGLGIWHTKTGILQVKIGDEWKYVFANNGGKLITTEDKQKALPGMDKEYFEQKFGNDEFRAVAVRSGKVLDSAVLDSVVVQITETGKMAEDMDIEKFAQRCCGIEGEVHGNAHALKLVDQFNADMSKCASTRRASLMHIGPKHADQTVAVAMDTAKAIIAGNALDSASMDDAIASLQIALDMVVTNEPINRAEGNIEQADYELRAADSFRAALKVLDDAKPNNDGKFVRTWAMLDSAVGNDWHSRTMERMKTLTDDALRYIIKDAREAARAAKSLGNAQAEGKYEDEANYAGMELTNRQKAAAKKK